MLWLLACTSDEPPKTPVQATPPSVLVVVMDTVRADALSAYGNPLRTSPQVDAVAQAGTLFEDATAPGSWTWPSHASLFTGLFPWEHGARAAQRDEGLVLTDTFLVTPMREDIPTLAEEFSKGGWTTRAVVANRLLSQPLGLTRGFDSVDYLERDDLVIDKAIEGLGGQQLLFVNLMHAHGPFQLSPATQHLAPQLEAKEHGPWRVEGGLSWHTQDPNAIVVHATEGLPDTTLQLAKNLYEGEVLEVDRHLNRLLAAWTAQYPDGVVAITSDHGELFGEHGAVGHRAVVWPELVQVPLVLVGPGVPAGVRRDDPVMLQDLHPTLLELAGLAQPTWSLLSEAPRPGAIQSAAWPQPHLADSLGGIWATGHVLYREGDDRLYVAGDERVLIRDGVEVDDPERIEELAAKAVTLEFSTGGTQLEPDAIEALRALGYVQ